MNIDLPYGFLAFTISDSRGSLVKPAEFSARTLNLYVVPWVSLEAVPLGSWQKPVTLDQ